MHFFPVDYSVACSISNRKRFDLDLKLREELGRGSSSKWRTRSERNKRHLGSTTASWGMPASNMCAQTLAAGNSQEEQEPCSRSQHSMIGVTETSWMTVSIIIGRQVLFRRCGQGRWRGRDAFLHAKQRFDTGSSSRGQQLGESLWVWIREEANKHGIVAAMSFLQIQAPSGHNTWLQCGSKLT